MAASSALSVTELNNVKVYNLTSGKTLPEWLAQKTRTSLKKDEDYRRRIELLQDFDFNTASQGVLMTRDGEYCVAVGTYPPMVKVFEVEQLAIKFERHLDAEVVTFCVLGDSWGKLAFLHVDRTIEFHAPYGRHYRTRIPHAGRDMLYHESSCDLYVASSSPSIYRLNLEEGKFMAPIESASPAVNVLAQNTHLQLLASGGEDGLVEIWDLRTNKRVGAFSLPACLPEAGVGGGAGDSTLQVTALEFAPGGAGMVLAVGSSAGHVALFDIRSTTPILVKEHQYGDPILRIRFHENSGTVISADKHVIKIWDASTGKAVTNIEPTGAVNDFSLVAEKKAGVDLATGRGSGDTTESGVILVAGEQPRMMAFYVPQIGVAPYWCSFIDSLTEELEESESAGRIYEDYKFVTRDELKRLSLQHLIGTPLLKTYMHGFFMHAKLYARLQSVADPFAYDKWKKEQVKKKIADKRKSRITMQRRLPKVNADLAQQIIDAGDEDAETKSKRKNKKGGKEKPSAGNVMADPRFSALFTNPDFQIDPDNVDYKRRHGGVSGPVGKAARSRGGGGGDGEDSDGDIAELFQAVGGAGAKAKAKGAKSTNGRREVRMFEANELAETMQLSGEGHTEKLAGVGLGSGADAVAVAAARKTRARLSASLAKRVKAEADTTKKRTSTSVYRKRDRAAFADEDGADLVGYEQLDEDAAAAAKHAAKKTSSGRKKKSKKQRR